MTENFYHPRYWFVWLSFGLLKLGVKLPFPVQAMLGRSLGCLLLALSPRRKKIALINIGLCFPEWDEKQRQDMLWRNAEAMGLAFFENAMAYWWTDEKIRSISEIQGVENLRDAVSQGKGVILLFGHFTTLEIMSRILRLYTPFHPVYRKQNNPLVEYLIRRERFNFTDKLIKHDDIRSMYRSIIENVPLFYIPDRNFGPRQSIFVPFFGIPTATISATSRLAGFKNSPVLPMVQQRLPGNRGYRLIIEKPLENFPGNDLYEDTARINRIIENQIRQNPENYLWVHRRFKTRPDGEESFYQ